MKIYSDDNVISMVLEKGEMLHEKLGNAAKEFDIPGAFITGIGTVTDVSIGFFQKENKSYKEIALKGEYELLALNGNISWEDQHPVIHLHATLGKEDGSLLGGHLIKAAIAVTGEVFIHKIEKRLKRRKIEEVGLSLIQ